MPNAPLIDVDALDLSREVASKADIYALLRQRGTFELLDGVLHIDDEKSLLVAYRDIKADEWWTKDHIPGRPLFPGALMIEASAQACSYDFMRRQEVGSEIFVGFGGLENTRFRGIVTPGSRMLFAGVVRRLRSRMFTYYVQGIVEKTLVFETDVLGVVV